jgi:hypothetical protein
MLSRSAELSILAVKGEAIQLYLLAIDVIGYPMNRAYLVELAWLVPRVLDYDFRP